MEVSNQAPEQNRNDVSPALSDAELQTRIEQANQQNNPVVVAARPNTQGVFLHSKTYSLPEGIIKNAQYASTVVLNGQNFAVYSVQIPSGYWNDKPRGGTLVFMVASSKVKIDAATRIVDLVRAEPNVDFNSIRSGNEYGPALARAKAEMTMLAPVTLYQMPSSSSNNASGSGSAGGDESAAVSRSDLAAYTVGDITNRGLTNGILTVLGQVGGYTSGNAGDNAALGAAINAAANYKYPNARKNADGSPQITKAQASQLAEDLTTGVAGPITQTAAQAYATYKRVPFPASGVTRDLPTTRSNEVSRANPTGSSGTSQGGSTLLAPSAGAQSVDEFLRNPYTVGASAAYRQLFPDSLPEVSRDREFAALQSIAKDVYPEKAKLTQAEWNGIFAAIIDGKHPGVTRQFIRYLHGDFVAKPTSGERLNDPTSVIVKPPETPVPPVSTTTNNPANRNAPDATVDDQPVLSKEEQARRLRESEQVLLGNLNPELPPAPALTPLSGTTVGATGSQTPNIGTELFPVKVPALSQVTPLIDPKGTLFGAEMVPRFMGGELGVGNGTENFMKWVGTLTVEQQSALGAIDGFGKFLVGTADGLVTSVATAGSGFYGLANVATEQFGITLPGVDAYNEYNQQVREGVKQAGGDLIKNVEEILHDPMGKLLFNPLDNAAIQVANNGTFKLTSSNVKTILDVGSSAFDVLDLANGVIKAAGKGAPGAPSFSLDTTGLNDVFTTPIPDLTKGSGTPSRPTNPSTSRSTSPDFGKDAANQVLKRPRAPGEPVLAGVKPGPNKSPNTTVGAGPELPRPPTKANPTQNSAPGGGGSIGANGPQATVGPQSNNPTGPGQPQQPNTPAAGSPINPAAQAQPGGAGTGVPSQTPTTNNGGAAAQPPRAGEMLEDGFVALYHTRPVDAMQEALMRSTPTSDSRLDNGVPIDREVILRDANGDIAARVLIRRDEGSFSHGMGDHLNFQIQLARPDPGGSVRDPATGQIVTPNVLQDVPGSNLHILFGDPTRPRFPTDLGVNRGRNQGVDWFSQRDPAAHAADQVRARDEYDRLYGAAAASTATPTASANVTNAISNPSGRTSVGNSVLDFTAIGSSASSPGNVGLASDLTGDMRLRGFDGFDPNRPQLPLPGAVVGMGSNAPVGLPALNVPGTAAPRTASTSISEAFSNPSSRPMIDRDGTPFGASSSGGNFAIDRNGPTFTSDQFVLRPAGLPTASVVPPSVPGAPGTPQLWSQLDAARPPSSADLANQLSNPISRPGVEGQSIEFGAPSRGGSYAIDNNSGITFRPGQVRLDSSASSSAGSVPQQSPAAVAAQKSPDPLGNVPPWLRPDQTPPENVPNLSTEPPLPLDTGGGSGKTTGGTAGPTSNAPKSVSLEMANFVLNAAGQVGTGVFVAGHTLLPGVGRLPAGLTPQQALADYLARPRDYIAQNVNNIGPVSLPTSINPDVLVNVKTGQMKQDVPQSLYDALVKDAQAQGHTNARQSSVFLEDGKTLKVVTLDQAGERRVIELTLPPASRPLQENFNITFDNSLNLDKNFLEGKSDKSGQFGALTAKLQIGPADSPNQTTLATLDFNQSTSGARKEAGVLTSGNVIPYTRMFDQTNVGTLAQLSAVQARSSDYVRAVTPEENAIVLKSIGVVGEAFTRKTAAQTQYTPNGWQTFTKNGAGAEIGTFLKLESNNPVTGNQWSGILGNQYLGGQGEFGVRDGFTPYSRFNLDDPNLKIVLARDQGPAPGFVTPKGLVGQSVVPNDPSQPLLRIAPVEPTPLNQIGSPNPFLKTAPQTLPRLKEIGPGNLMKPGNLPSDGQKRSLTDGATPDLSRLQLDLSSPKAIAFDAASSSSLGIDPNAFDRLDFLAPTEETALDLQLNRLVNDAVGAALDVQEALPRASASGAEAQAKTTAEKPLLSSEDGVDLLGQLGAALVGKDKSVGQLIAGGASLVNTIGRTNTDGVQGNVPVAATGVILSTLGEITKNPIIGTLGGVAGQVNASMIAGTQGQKLGQEALAQEAAGNLTGAADLRVKESQARLAQSGATIGIAGEVLQGLAKVTGSKEIGYVAQATNIAAVAVPKLNNGIAGDGALSIGTGALQLASAIVPGKAGQFISSGASIVNNVVKIAKGGFGNITGGIGGIVSAIAGFVPGVAGKVMEWIGLGLTALTNPVSAIIAVGMKFMNTRKGALGDHAADMKADFNGDGVRDLLTIDNDKDVKIKQGFVNTVQFDTAPIKAQIDNRGSAVADGLAPGQFMTSPSGKYATVLTMEGMLAVFEQGADADSAKPIWTMNAATPNGVVAIQNDGRLAALTESPRGDGMTPIWKTPVGATGQGPHYLEMQDDGNLVLIKGTPGNPSGVAWSSAGGHAPPEFSEPDGYVQVAKFEQEGYLDKVSQLEGIGLQDVNNDGKLDFVFPDSGMTLINQSTLKDVSFYDKGQRDHADAMAAKMKTYTEAPVLGSVIAVAKPRGGFELKDTTATSRNRGADAAGEIVFAGKQIEGWVTIKRPDNTLARVAIGMMGGSEDEGPTGYAASGVGAKWLAANRPSAPAGTTPPVGAAPVTTTQADAAAANALVTQAYQQVLGRTPDAGGLAANVNAMTAGALSIMQIRENLLNSAERQHYLASQASATAPDTVQATAPAAVPSAAVATPPPVNPQIVQADAQITQAYQEILGRIPDEGGLVSNRNALLGGTSLDQVRVNLLGSAERQTYLNNQLTAMYKEVLRRDPDAGGLAANLASVNGGAQTLTQIRQNLLESTERKVVNAYQDLLNRAPDPAGLQYWWGLMNSGQMDETQMRAAISESALIEKRAA
jgi:hypothetical protein